MSDQRLSIAERVQVLDRLNAIAWELNQIASWLASRDVETESDMADRAARDLLASCWLLERPIRPQLPPERWQQPHPQPGSG